MLCSCHSSFRIHWPMGFSIWNQELVIYLLFEIRISNLFYYFFLKKHTHTFRSNEHVTKTAGSFGDQETWCLLPPATPPPRLEENSWFAPIEGEGEDAVLVGNSSMGSPE